MHSLHNTLYFFEKGKENNFFRSKRNDPMTTSKNKKYKGNTHTHKICRLSACFASYVLYILSVLSAAIIVALYIDSVLSDLLMFLLFSDGANDDISFAHGGDGGGGVFI